MSDPQAPDPAPTAEVPMGEAAELPAHGPGTPGRGTRWMLAVAAAVVVALAAGYAIGRATGDSSPQAFRGPGGGMGPGGQGFPGGMPGAGVPGAGMPGGGMPGGGMPGDGEVPNGQGFPGGMPGGAGMPGSGGMPNGGGGMASSMAAGTIRSIDGDRLVVTTRSGREVTVALSGDTQVLVGSDQAGSVQPGSRNDLAEGATVVVAGRTVDGELQATRVRVTPS